MQEQAEQFELVLLCTTGGALLGDRRTSLVTIAKSDYPNGAFGFGGTLNLTISNPRVTEVVTLVIDRRGGLLGKTEKSVHSLFRIRTFFTYREADSFLSHYGSKFPVHYPPEHARHCLSSAEY